MTTIYLDSSVILRIILRSPDPLPEWDFIPFSVSSALLEVECYRTIHRMRHTGELTAAEAEAKRAKVDEMLRDVQLRAIEPQILARAAEPFPASVATLDAIHLATAVAYRDERPILFATHDKQLAKAAAALRFEVIGVAA